MIAVGSPLGGEERGAPPNAASTQSTDMGREPKYGGASVPDKPGLVCIFPRDIRAAPPVWRVSGSALIGRGRGADIDLGDKRVSRAHARVRSGAEGLHFEDLGSRHGSALRGQAIGSKAMLATYGEVVRVGDTLLLAVQDVERYAAAPRRIQGGALGLTRDMLAGPALAESWDQAARVANLAYPVMVLGESGVGKEVIARLVHRAGNFAGPFVGINVAALPAALFEAELFGYERGAFTGAQRSRLGAFREASGGVLFLDEIAELRSDLQAKLLRAIDLGAVRPLGADRDVSTPVRIVAATSRDLERARQEDQFRADLYHRLMGVVIRVPPLRQRPDDVVLLALDQLEESEAAFSLSAAAAEQLALGTWEGNVRSLRFAVSHAIAAAHVARRTEVKSEDLPSLPQTRMERALSETDVRAAMTRAGGVASRAAEVLGVSRTTLYNACKRLGIAVDSLRAQ